MDTPPISFLLRRAIGLGHHPNVAPGPLADASSSRRLEGHAELLWAVAVRMQSESIFLGAANPSSRQLDLAEARSGLKPDRGFLRESYARRGDHEGYAASHCCQVGVETIVDARPGPLVTGGGRNRFLFDR